MIRLIACSKIFTAAQSARLHMKMVAKIHGIPLIIYTDRSNQCTSNFSKEIWGLFGTQLTFSTIHHPQTQEIMECIDAVIGQVLRCTLLQMNNIKCWIEFLPIVELNINYLPNRSIVYSPFFLNYGDHPTVLADLLCGNEITDNYIVGSFCK